MIRKINLKTVVPFILIFITFGGIFSLQQKYSNQYIKNLDGKVDYTLEQEKLSKSLHLQKKLPTLGFDNVMASWFYLQFIQYLGDTKAREKTGFSSITDYFELVSKYDPRFLWGNLILSTANSLYAGRPDKSVEFLNKVIPYNSPEINPDSFSLWNYKGTDEILFLGDIPAAINSYTMSVKWAEARGDELGKTTAKRNRETVEFLQNKSDSKKAQVAAWGTILFSALDNNTRKMAIDRIESLGGKVTQEDNKFIVKLPQED